MQCCFAFNVTMNFLSSRCVCDVVTYITCLCMHDPIWIDRLSSLSLSLFSFFFFSFSFVCMCEVNLPRTYDNASLIFRVI